MWYTYKVELAERSSLKSVQIVCGNARSFEFLEVASNYEVKS
jgi:hypothetical protein